MVGTGTKDLKMNVTLNPDFKQVCVWSLVSVCEDEEEDFVKYIASELGTRAQFLETIFTAPDFVDGSPVEGTGGLPYVFFAVHNDDIGKFAVPRLRFGIRWIEDVLDTEKFHNQLSLYPARVSKYRCW
jgi:hypothetical protein